MKVIFRADDLGFSEGVNYGINKAIRDGVITSVGLMSNMEKAKHGYELIKDTNVCLGLHTNLCVGKPVSDVSLIPSLVQENGDFCSSREIRNRTEDKIVVEEAMIEIEAQLMKFKEITGQMPDYFECHAIKSQNFVKALKTVAKKYNLFYENCLFDTEFEKENEIYGAPMGPYDEKGLYDPKALCMNQLDFIKTHHCTVFIFHPGFLDQYLLNTSSFTLIRPMETDFLCSDWVKNWIKDNHIEVVSFKDVSNV